MINQVYQLIRPKFINVKYKEVDINEGVIIRPKYMALCHADQRYYQGKRDPKILAKKLPMALIHECCGEVISDSTGTFKIGQKVIVIPNQPPKESDDEFFENYMLGTRFLSSGHDGFMQEIISLSPDRVVPYENIEDVVATITEFVSIATHAVERFKRVSHRNIKNIAIYGDGSLSYVLSNVLSYNFPKSNIIVIGRHQEKLKLFGFVKETYISDFLPDDLKFDHAFECCGGDGSQSAINSIIDHINPQGSIILMGVSENKVNINTRDILEKGITLVGTSRSGREDFLNAVEILENDKIARRMNNIIYQAGSVKTLDDIHTVFEKDTSTTFKTVFKWEI